MIPNKSNFKFQELTPITGVKPYVIRFWETEFEEIAPFDSDSGQKIYSRNDVENILRVKQLLFEEKLSIPEAKLVMKTRDWASAQTKEIHSEQVQKVELPKSQNQEILKSILIESVHTIREIKRSRGW